MKYRKKSKWLMLVAALALVSLFAASCGSDDDDDAGSGATTTAADSPDTPEQPSTPASPEAPEEPSSPASPEEPEPAEPPDSDQPEVPMFGNKPWPCGPGEASGATYQGVTDDAITIGIGDDRGYPASPGLNAHQTEAVINFIDKCNELGGINGREIQYINYDAAILQAATRMTEACEQVFMLVGEGFSLDQAAEPIRVGCELGAVPAWTVSVDFAHGPWQVNAVPNPGDQTPMSMAVHVSQIASERGYDIEQSGAMFGNFSATQETWLKVQATYPDYGYEFNQALEYDINGEADWTPFIQQLKDDGVEVVYFTGSCPFFYQFVRESADLNEFDAIWLADANFYDTACSGVNESGALNNTFIRMVFIPFEEASTNKATQDFIDVLDEAGNEQKTLLGMQAVSSFLLWATGAAACGSALTRDCVLDEIREITEWDGHGLHVVTNPGSNEAPTCGMLMELTGTGYQRALPEEPGTFDCDDAWNSTVEIEAVINAQLDDNRISQRHLGG